MVLAVYMGEEVACYLGPLNKTNACIISLYLKQRLFEFIFRFVQMFQRRLDPTHLRVSVHRLIHYTTGEGVFNTQNQGYLKIPRF